MIPVSEYVIRSPSDFKRHFNVAIFDRDYRCDAEVAKITTDLERFGAHGLKDLLAQNGMAAIWEKAVFYHFIHAVMLFVLAERKPFSAVAWWSFLVGIFFFSGSLYLLAATNAHWLGVITPIGGVSFVVGWTRLIISTGRGNPAAN